MALSSVQPIPCLQDVVSLSKESAYKLSLSDCAAISSATAFQSTKGDVGTYLGVPSTSHSELVRVECLLTSDVLEEQWLERDEEEEEGFEDEG